MNFEQEYEFGTTVTVNRTRDFRRGDSHRTLTVGSESAVSDPEREARIVTHQRRIQAGLRALKRDPSRTTLLRRRLANQMKVRFRRLRQVIRELVVADDAFGLVTGTLVEMQMRQAWRFQTDAGKVASYRKWLQGQVDEKILTVGGVDGKPWTSDYVEYAYKKGMGRSYGDVTKLEAGIFEGTKEQFLRDAFSAPEMLSKIELVSTRAFTQLRGVTDAMSQQMSRILADGLSAGRGPAAMARELTDNVTKLTNTRALVLARTEIIHAHAEGQLDGFERLGVKEVGIEAELSTAGDDLVCERCHAAEADGPYPVKQARGMVPVHPNCRCAWVPVTERKKKEEVLEYRLPELPDTPEAKGLLATEKGLTTRTATVRKAYRAGDKKLRPELMRLKEELRVVRAKMDDLARGVTPAPVPPAPVPPVPVTPVSKPIVPKPPVPVTPAPAATAGTKFATAEDYRQYLLQQVEAAKTPEIAREISRLSGEAKVAWKKWSKVPSATKQSDEAWEAANTIDKRLKVLRKQISVDVEVQRQLLDEVSNQVGKCDLLAEETLLKNIQNVADDILRWVPGKRKTSYEFGWVDIGKYAKGRGGDLGVYHTGSEPVIELYTKSKQVFAHEFGHHIAYRLRGFMKAQTRFFQSRTAGEKIVQLMKDITGKKDKWARLDIYAGRVYSGGQPSEVASIGIEYLWKNPAKFAAKDPEWFNMIVSQLKGIPVR